VDWGGEEGDVQQTSKESSKGKAYNNVRQWFIARVKNNERFEGRVGFLK